MQKEVDVLLVGVFVNMIDAVSIELRGAAFDTVYFVSFFQKEFCKVGAVLPCDPGNEGYRPSLTITVFGDFARDFFVGHRYALI